MDMLPGTAKHALQSGLDSWTNGLKHLASGTPTGNPAPANVRPASVSLGWLPCAFPIP